MQDSYLNNNFNLYHVINPMDLNRNYTSNNINLLQSQSSNELNNNNKQQSITSNNNNNNNYQQQVKRSKFSHNITNINISSNTNTNTNNNNSIPIIANVTQNGLITQPSNVFILVIFFLL